MVDKALQCAEQLEWKKLARDSLEEAEKIQRKLMVDWASMCGTWMVGIKHLIQEIKRILTCLLYTSPSPRDS